MYVSVYVYVGTWCVYVGLYIRVGVCRYVYVSVNCMSEYVYGHVCIYLYDLLCGCFFVGIVVGT